MNDHQNQFKKKRFMLLIIGKDGDQNISCTKRYLISPVNAPPFLTQQFWAATWNSGFSSLLTEGMNTKGGLTTTSKKKTILVALTV